MRNWCEFRILPPPYHFSNLCDLGCQLSASGVFQICTCKPLHRRLTPVRIDFTCGVRNDHHVHFPLHRPCLFTQWQIGAVDKILTKKPLDLQQRLCMCERYRVSQCSCYFSIFTNCQEPCPADALAQFLSKKYSNATLRQTFITSISAKRGLTGQKPNRSDTYLPAKRSKRQNSLIMNAASKIKYSYHVAPRSVHCSLQQNF